MKQKKTIKLLALLAVMVFTTNADAQITIGSEIAPNAGALLDLKTNTSTGANSTKGFNLPRVALTSLSALDPCVANATAAQKLAHKGLQVYNTNATLGEGILTWNGTKWSSFAIETQIITGKVLITGIISSATGYTDLKFAEIDIVKAGVYLVEAAAYISSSEVNYGYLRMKNSTLSKEYWVESDYVGRGTDNYAWKRISRCSVVNLTPGKYYLTISGNTGIQLHISAMNWLYKATLLNY